MKYLRNLGKNEMVGKTCLLRVDFNVESAEDAFRLESILPTINFLLESGARVVLLSHKGRPDLANSELRIVNSEKEKLTLRFAVPFLENNLKREINFLEDIPESLPEGEVFLVENLRFWQGEEANGLEFAKRLAKLGDFYVNDAFAVSHRENASVTQLPKLMPAYAGLVLEKEIENLGKVMKNPEKPMVLIFGGSKVEDKLPVIKNLLPDADRVLLGSASLARLDLVPKSEKILLPVDSVKKNDNALDIGKETIEKYALEIKKAKTIIWNGPLGLFEEKEFAIGSEAVAKAVAESGAFSVVGGGETTQLILKMGLREKISFLSTGGGAMLEFLAGKKLPGIVVLE